MKKIISSFLFICLFFLSLSAQSFRGQRIAVPEPTFQNAPEDEKWIPIFVQGQLTTVLQNYTDKVGVKLIDRQNIAQCIQEQKFSEKTFIEENTQLQVGKLVAANYIVSISILKKKSTYAVDCRINNAETGEAVGKAFRNPNCTANYLENGNLINDMGYALLLGIGVSERDLSALREETNTKTQSSEQKQIVSDNTNLAKGISTERGGGTVEQIAVYYDKINDDSGMSGEALWRLGKKYYNGEGVSIDYARAFEYFKESAEKGNIFGQNDIGVCYARGRGVEKDNGKAFYWYSKSAEQGCAVAQTNLGVYYSNGTVVGKDYGKAFYWFSKSAEQENADAQYNLGVFYDFGLSIQKDTTKAIYWYSKAAEQGHSLAQYNLGACIYFGYGVKKDYNKAFYLFSKSAEQGNSFAQHNLGACFYFGYGVKKDYNKAFYWWSKAAEQGHSSAQYNLGNCYYDGIGTTKDKEKAIYWWKKASEQGDENAKSELKKIGR